MNATALAADSITRPVYSHGGARKGAGKKKGTRHTAEPVIGKRILLNDAQWAYLACWFPSTNPSEQARELVRERGRKLWPMGPRTSPRLSHEAQVRNAGPTGKMLDRAAAELGPYVGRKVYLTAAEWAWVAHFHVREHIEANGRIRAFNESHQFRALLSLAESMWPTGPYTNPQMNEEQLARHAGDGDY